MLLYSSGKVETDVFYKPTNTHDYLNFNSHHPHHVKANIPYTLAKRIIAFTSDPEKEKSNLKDLKGWLLNCGYPNKIIQKKFHNARLQGPANYPVKNNTISLVSTFSSNYDVKPILNKCHTLLKNLKDPKLKEIFKDSRPVLSFKQPKNILRILSSARFISHTEPIKKNGLFRCSNTLCKLCKLYIQEGDHFYTANDTKWLIKTDISCKSKNVIYYLKCVSCHFKVTYIGKTNDLRLRMNNHISACRHGESSDIFDNHVYKCRLANNHNDEPYFHIHAFIKLPDERLLLSYESYLHSKRYDTMN